MLINNYYLGVAALVGGCILLIRRALHFRRYPSTPGPKLAAWSNIWYTWKVWEGSFEKWNINAHAAQGAYHPSLPSIRSIDLPSGKVLRITPDMYSIDDPAAAKIIYAISKPMPKGPWYKKWGPFDNHNLFNAQDRQFHSEMRRRVSNLYSMSSIKHYEPYVDNCIAVILEKFDQFAASGESFDVQRWMQCYAFDVIGELTVR